MTNKEKAAIAIASLLDELTKEIEQGLPCRSKADAIVNTITALIPLVQFTW